MEEFVSLNELESTLLAARQGHVPTGDFVQQLLLSEIALPTASEVQADGSGFEPVLFEKQGTTMLAAFTAKERVAQLGQMAQFCLMIKGAEVLRRIPKGYGLVVNPGLKVGFEISPEGISEILAEFG
jgi:hypothetical protein